MTKYVPALCSFLIVAYAATAAFAQRSQNVVPIAGCYSNLGEVNGDIVGNGNIVLKKTRHGFAGNFQELRNESGEAFPPTTLENIRVDEKHHTIRFYVTATSWSGDGKGGTVTTRQKAVGKISRRGLKISGVRFLGDYGGPNPFLRRSKNCGD